MTRTTNLAHQIRGAIFQKRNMQRTEKTVTVDKNVINIHPNLHPEVVGKRVHVKYDDTDGGCDWYEGIIVTFNCISGKYGVFFPSDNTSEEFSLNEEGFVIID